MRCSYLGTEYSNDEIKEILNQIGANFKTLSKEDILNFTSERLTKGDAIGWFQDKMEFGPRALGCRSIF